MPGARIPELEKCICGCSLELGSKIVAGLFFVLSSFAFICSIITVIWKEYEDRKYLPDESMGAYRRGVIVEIAFLAILSGISSTLSAMLFYGVIKHKASYILPWCILTTAFNAILLFLNVLSLLVVRDVSWIQVFMLLVIAAVFYAVLVVYGHFRELRRQKNNPATFTNTE